MRSSRKPGRDQIGTPGRDHRNPHCEGEEARYVRRWCWLVSAGYGLWRNQDRQVMDLSPHVGGRSREMGLGSLSIFGLTEARTKATECRKLTYEGIDPIELVGSSAPMPRLRQPHHWPSRTARSNTLPLTARVGATPSMPRKECNAQDLCRTGDWRAAGPKHRHRPGHEDYRAALVDEAGNSIAAAWPDRGSAGLGNGAGLSPRRQSCALARPSR